MSMPVTVPSAVSLTRRGLLGFALVWQALWMLADVRLWPSNQSHLLESVLVGLSWITWGLLLVSVFVWRQNTGRQRLTSVLAGLNLVILSLAAISISLLSIDPTVNDWITSASIFNLVAGLTGITVWNPRQWTWVFLICAIELSIFIGFGFVFVGEMTLNSVILYPLYALAIGVAAASAQRGLATGAETTDSMAMASLEREAQARLINSTEILVTQIQRKVHETVLNTLTAISRGNLPRTESVQKMITERSAESAKVLAEFAGIGPLTLQMPASNFIDSISDLIEECGYRGISISIDGDWGNSLSDEAENSLVAAVRESLINVLRHSEATHVTLEIRRTKRKNFQIIVQDDGVGFEAGGRSGFGLSTILKSDLEAIGASVNVDSSTGNGCTVQIDYEPNDRKLLSMQHQSQGPMSNFVLPIVAAWLLFSFVNIVLVWDSYSNPLLNMFAFAVLSTVGFVTIYVSFSGSIPWWLVLIGSLFAYLGYEIEQRAIGLANVNQWTEWSSELIVAIFFVFAAAGTWWSWFVAASVWLFIQDNWPAEFLAAGFVMIMTGAYLGWVLRRNNRVIKSAIEMAASDAQQAFLSQLHIKSRYPGLAYVNPGPTIELLKKISEGSLNWESPDVQHASAVHEAYIRNVLMSRNVSASRIIGNVSKIALDRGVILESSISEFLFLGDCVQQAMSTIESLIEMADAGKIVRFTVSGESDCAYFQLVGAIRHDLDISSLAFPNSGELEFEPDEDGYQDFVWQGRCGSHSGTLTRVVE